MAISESREIDFEKIECWASYNLADILRQEGSYGKAIEYYFVNLEYDERIGDPYFVALDNMDIGITFIQMGDLESANRHLQTGLNGILNIGDKSLLAPMYNSLGEMHYKGKNADSAIYYFQKASTDSFNVLSIEKVDYYTQVSRAFKLKYTQTSESMYLDSMRKWVLKADLLYSKLGLIEKYPSIPLLLAYYFNRTNDVQKEQEHIDLALEYIDKSNDLETKLEVVGQAAAFYQRIGQHKKANELLLQERQLLNEKHNSSEILAAARYASNFVFAKQLLADSLEQEAEKLELQLIHQVALRKKNRNRNILIGSVVMFLLISGGLYNRNRFIKRAKDLIEKEKDRSDELLLNILPSEIAEELKANGKADAKDFELVSILFTDFKDFTKQSAKMNAKDLVSEINHCFEAFDKIIDKYEIEKIKTIGDSYMAAGGIPVPHKDSVKHTVLASLEMQKFISERKATNKDQDVISFEMRLGIHSGSVVAGIVGVKKFQYDIWGDTVNTASRMESYGEVGKVNISQATYEIIKDDPDFVFEHRGKMEVKGKGALDMWFVSLA